MSYLKTNHQRIPFYRVKQNLYRTTLTNWKCTYHKNSRMPMLLSGFFESGILSKLKYFEQYTIMLLRRKGTAVVRSRMHPVQPIHLSDSIHTVFILYATLASLAGLVLMIELYAQTFNRMIIWNLEVSLLMRQFQRGCYKERRSFNLYVIRYGQLFVNAYQR